MIEALELSPIPDEDEAIRPQIRAFLAERLAGRSATQRARTWQGYDRDFSRDLAARGWVGVTLPKEYGGGGRSQFARFVIVEELLAAGAPVASHWIAERQSAPLILRYGAEPQRRQLLPKIIAGDACFCIGMSEPGSGSDLASVRSRAEHTDKGWLLNGEKIWTTYGHKADYMIILVRTSGGPEDRNAGLSQFLVDLTLPGVTRSPIRDLAGDDHFSQLFFDNVLLPEEALLGAEGQGWAQVTAELAFERSGPERIYSSVVLMDAWLKFVRDKGPASDQELELAGRLLAEITTLRSMSLAVTGKLNAGGSPVVEASVVKDLGTSFEQNVPRLLSDHLASLDGVDIPQDLRGALDYIAAISPAFSLRGGTREILRAIIARGLGLR